MEEKVLPKDKFPCGYALCTKISEYCYDPSGTKDTDYMICKPCSLNIDQCKDGDFHPGCSKFCFDLYEQSMSNRACQYEYFLYLVIGLALLNILFVFCLLVTCKLCNLNLKGRKILLHLKNLRDLVCRRVTNPEGEKMLQERETDKKSEDEDGAGDTPTLPKSVSADDVEKTAENGNGRDADLPPNPTGIQNVDEHVDGVGEDAAHPLDLRGTREIGTVERGSHNNVRLNGIPNAGTDTPVPAFQ